jgi:predicted nucleic acid-binding protein
MRRYLLDTPLLAAYLQGRRAAVELMTPWVEGDEVVTSILAYGEVVEYLKEQPNFSARHSQLLDLLNEVVAPYFLSYEILERYADTRRQLRSPHGAGLIGDIDTLIAATALEHGLAVVTTDEDFQRVPVCR